MNDLELTTATRQHFANICLACIKGATTGEYKVNDLDRYVERQTAEHYDILAGMNDNTFTFQQYKHYLATGNCVALLP